MRWHTYTTHLLHTVRFSMTVTMIKFITQFRRPRIHKIIKQSYTLGFVTIPDITGLTVYWIFISLLMQDRTV